MSRLKPGCSKAALTSSPKKGKRNILYANDKKKKCSLQIVLHFQMHRYSKRLKWILLIGLSFVFIAVLAVYKGTQQRGQLPWWHWDVDFDTADVDTREGKATPAKIPDRDASKDSKIQAKNRSKVIILNDQPFFDFDKNLIFSGQTCGGDCMVTFDTSYRGVADAILYHCVDQKLANPIPTRSHMSQLFVFLCLENPWTTKYTRLGRIRFDQVDDIFNLTMSYRFDSDIHIPYSTSDIVLRSLQSKREFDNFEQLMKKKTRHSIWIVSNCHVTKGSLHRMEIVSELVSAGLQIDLFGSCFRSFEESMTDLISRYRFYFSLENSFHCRDYITEKVWINGLQMGAIPVIWGPRKSDVQRFLPPDSYILVENFSSPEELVRYLNFLSENDEEYAKYFKWRFDAKKQDEVIWEEFENDLVSRMYCEACKVLNSEQEIAEHKIVKSVNDWWYGTEVKACLAPQTFRDGIKFVNSYIHLKNIRVPLTLIGILLILLIFRKCGTLYS